MLIPYISKYACAGCGKKHRISFRQWRESFLTAYNYLKIHAEKAGGVVAVERAENKFGVKKSIISRWLMSHYRRL